jgi:hypothetical protein
MPAVRQTFSNSLDVNLSTTHHRVIACTYNLYLHVAVIRHHLLLVAVAAEGRVILRHFKRVGHAGLSTIVPVLSLVRSGMLMSNEQRPTECENPSRPVRQMLRGSFQRQVDRTSPPQGEKHWYC